MGVREWSTWQLFVDGVFRKRHTVVTVIIVSNIVKCLGKIIKAGEEMGVRMHGRGLSRERVGIQETGGVLQETIRGIQDTEAVIQDTAKDIQDIANKILLKILIQDIASKILFKIPLHDTAHDINHDIMTNRI